MTHELPLIVTAATATNGSSDVKSLETMCQDIAIKPFLWVGRKLDADHMTRPTFVTVSMFALNGWRKERDILCQAK